MNYRHAYHAGNFADVLKHIVLARVITYFKRKEAPFRIIDTHAGSGRYRLTSDEAQKTGEWRNGIGRLLGTDAAPLSRAVDSLVSPYLDAVRAENSAGLEFYPGSPRVALALMRPQDVLVANELHPEEFVRLKALIGRDPRARLTAIDGWTAVKALLPPTERRGITLIDPPFEEEGDLGRLVDGLKEGIKRFASGAFLLWYPIKDAAPIRRFHRTLSHLGLPALLLAELTVRETRYRERLNGCGLVIANPPFTLEAELKVILPELRHRLSESPRAIYRLERLFPKGG
jgi:23S rRNA (adenine2030-N6)-methyltransferase